jgi:DNA-directed RNA polymerase subunit K/omega
MDFKKTNASQTTITRDLVDFENKTGNYYKSIAIIAKRSNQIASSIKEELTSKLEEFATHNDTLEEIFENREQIEISKFYEKIPKPSLIAIQEFMEDKVYHRAPDEESEA